MFTNEKQACSYRNIEALLPISIKTLLDNLQQLSCCNSSTKSYYVLEM